MIDKEWIYLLKRSVNYCPIIGLLVVLSCLAFRYSAVQQLALVFTGITYVLDYIINARWRRMKMTIDKWPFVLCIVFFLLIPIWSILGIEEGHNLHHYVELYLPFAIFGVVGLLGMIPNVRIEWFAVVGLSTFCALVTYIVSQVGISHVFDAVHTVDNPFNNFRAAYISSHMQFNLYANMVLVLAIAALRHKSLHIVWRIILYIEILVTVMTLFISEGRTGLLTMLLIVGLSVMYMLWQRNKIVAVCFCLMGSCLVMGAVKHSLNSHYASISEEPRQYIWKVAIDMIKLRPILGYGAQTGHEEFVKRGLEDEKFYQYYAKSLVENPQFGVKYIGLMHPHNAFLEVWIAHGLLGVLLFLGILTIPMITTPKEQRFPVIICCLTFFVQAMFERFSNDLSPLLFMLVLLLVMHDHFLANRSLTASCISNQPLADRHDEII